MDLGKISKLEEFLSQYGRVLLKASLANIPIYFLSLYTILGSSKGGGKVTKGISMGRLGEVFQYSFSSSKRGL